MKGQRIENALHQHSHDQGLYPSNYTCAGLAAGAAVVAAGELRGRGLLGEPAGDALNEDTHTI